MTVSQQTTKNSPTEYRKGSPVIPLHHEFEKFELINMGFITDITICKRAEEETRLLLSISQAIADANDFHSALGVALSKVCEATGWSYGEAWIPRPNSTVLGSAE
ncbi:MAG: hypothetical protein NVS2B14_01840 [Chamaesiphon sp.]